MQDDMHIHQYGGGQQRPQDSRHQGRADRPCACCCRDVIDPLGAERLEETASPVVTVLTATAGQLLLTPAEAADVLRVSRSKMYELMRRGEVLSVRVGGSRRVPREALVGYVEQLTVAAVAAEQDRRRGWSADWRSYAPGLSA